MAKAKNEAKIKFTAETGEFNKAIQQANSEMTELRAEMKLNETQMKATGKTVEGLEKKHEILEKQLKASHDKTEALNQKVQKAVEIFGENSTEAAKLRTQLLNAQTAEEKLRQAVAECADEMKEMKGESKDTRTASEKLTDTIEEQQTELKKLKDAYADAVLQYGKNSDEAKDLAKQIGKLSRELRDNQTELGKAEKAADKLDKSFDNAGDAARDASDGFTVMKGALADLVSEAVQFGIDKVSEFIGYLKELPEATREFRQDIATLETSFDKAGFSSEEATQTWKDLYTIFGEDDRAVEAANLISKMADSQQDLNDWIKITQGVWGSYQDSLPVEGLAEAAMESAKTGKVTGVLADALNWGAKEGEAYGVQQKVNIKFTKLSAKELSKLTDKQKKEYEARKKQYEETEKYNKTVREATTAEDKFNLALEKLSTEEEREAFIKETLISLYGEAADKYEEASGAQLDAKEAAAELALAEAELAEKVEPCTTAWDVLKTELITAAIPAIESVCGVLEDALVWLKEHPATCKTLAVILGVLAVAFTGLAIALGVYAAAQWIANSAIIAGFLPALVAALPIIAAVVAAIAIVAVVAAYWDELKAAAVKCWDAIKEAWGKASEWFSTKVIDPIVKFFTGLWDSITEYCQKAWTSIRNAVSTAAEKVFSVVSKIWNKVKSVTSTVFNACKSVASSIWNGLKSVVTKVVDGVKSKVSSVWNGIKSTTSNVFNSVKSTVSNVWNKIKDAMLKPIEKARDKIKGIVDKIKGFFSGLKISLPKIKLPHFSITGKFSLNPPSVPKFSIKWYKLGAIFTKPTLFNTPFGFKGVGEAGAEAVLPINKLEGYIANAIEKTQNVVNLDRMAAAIEDLANRPNIFRINDRDIALATASASDSVSGLRSSFKSRGLALD